MTEAVTRAVRWALANEEVTTVMAKTAIDNQASMKVLQRVGMVQYDENEEITYWHTTHLTN